jgi:hypothetical protein
MSKLLSLSAALKIMTNNEDLISHILGGGPLFTQTGNATEGSLPLHTSRLCPRSDFSWRPTAL